MKFLSTQFYAMSILQIFGVLPYKYCSKINLVTSNKKYFICSIIIFCLIQFAVLDFFFSTAKIFSLVVQKGSQVTEMVHFILLTSYEIGLLVIFFNCLINRNKQIKCLNNIVQLEGAVNDLKYKLSQKEIYRKFRSTSTWYVCGWILY